MLNARVKTERQTETNRVFIILGETWWNGLSIGGSERHHDDLVDGRQGKALEVLTGTIARSMIFESNNMNDERVCTRRSTRAGQS